jgi:hypothetical protein
MGLTNKRRKRTRAEERLRRAKCRSIGLAYSAMMARRFEELERQEEAERAAEWRASVEELPLAPPLSDAAISRESIYGPRG